MPILVKSAKALVEFAQSFPRIREDIPGQQCFRKVLKIGNLCHGGTGHTPGEKSVLGLAEVFVAGFDVRGCFGIECFEKLKKLGRLEGFEIVGCAGAVGRAGCIDDD